MINGGGKERRGGRKNERGCAVEREREREEWDSGKKARE